MKQFNLKHFGQETNNLTLISVVTFTVAAIVILIFVSSFSSKTNSCLPSQDTLTTNPTWNIEHTSLPAEIIWQRSQLGRSIPNPPIRSTRNTWIAADPNSIAYGRIVVEEDCDFSTTIAALDIQTGKNIWEVDARSTFRRINSVGNGYVVSHPSGIYFINQKGVTLWENHDLPDRQVDSVYEVNGNLYVPSRNDVYKLSPVTGEVIEVINLPNVHGFFDDVAVVSVSDTRLEVVNMGHREWSDFAILWDEGAGLTSVYHNQIAIRYEDVILTFTRSPFNYIRAYDIMSADSLWTLHKPFLAQPILLGDKIVILTPDMILEFYDVLDGHILGSIHLEYQGSQESISTLKEVILAGTGNTVAIYFYELFEIIGIEVDL